MGTTENREIMGISEILEIIEIIEIAEDNGDHWKS